MCLIVESDQILTIFLLDLALQLLLGQDELGDVFQIVEGGGVACETGVHLGVVTRAIELDVEV